MKKIYEIDVSLKKRLELFRLMKGLKLGIDEVTIAFHSNSIRKLRVIGGEIKCMQ